MVKITVAVMVLLMLAACASPSSNKARDASGEGLGPTQGATAP